MPQFDMQRNASTLIFFIVLGLVRIVFSGSSGSCWAKENEFSQVLFYPPSIVACIIYAWDFVYFGADGENPCDRWEGG